RKSQAARRLKQLASHCGSWDLILSSAWSKRRLVPNTPFACRHPICSSDEYHVLHQYRLSRSDRYPADFVRSFVELRGYDSTLRQRDRPWAPDSLVIG